MSTSTPTRTPHVRSSSPPSGGGRRRAVQPRRGRRRRSRRSPAKRKGRRILTRFCQELLGPYPLPTLIRPLFPAFQQSGREDSNLRPLDPQSSALTRLRYAPGLSRSRFGERDEADPTPTSPVGQGPLPDANRRELRGSERRPEAEARPRPSLVRRRAREPWFRRARSRPCRS